MTSEYPIESENFLLPENYWPISLDLLNSLPALMRPSLEEVQSLKYPWEILDLIMLKLVEKIDSQDVKTEDIKEFTSIEGPVIIEEGVHIDNFVSIIGPAYIGNRARIYQNCVVRHSVIGANTVLGFKTEIAGSLVGENCQFHDNHFADAILGNHVWIAGKAIASNTRLDLKTIKVMVGTELIDSGKYKLGPIIGSNTKVGIGCQLMPGILIGNNCLIKPGVILKRNLADSSMVKLVQQHQVTATQ